jgi:hypothetical protein
LRSKLERLELGKYAELRAKPSSCFHCIHVKSLTVSRAVRPLGQAAFACCSIQAVVFDLPSQLEVIESSCFTDTRLASGNKFVTSSSFSLIPRNASPFLKAKRIIKLRGHMMLTGSKFEVSSGLEIIPRNALTVLKAEHIMELG